MNITLLLVKTSFDGNTIRSKEIINLDILTLKKLLAESSMLIFKHGSNDPEEIILDAYENHL